MVMTAVMSVMTLGGCGADSTTSTTTAATAEISSAAETTVTTETAAETESGTGLLAKIKDSGKLVVGTASGYPPYEFVDITSADQAVIGVDISRLVSGIVALTINSTAYICEIVRGGILSVDRGQTEGALALGMSNARTLLCIVLPQAMKNILPSLSNEFITIIKTSSQVSVIGIGELMYAADTIRGISFQPMAPLILVALIYFLITSVFSFILKKIEKRMSRSTQRVAN